MIVTILTWIVGWLLSWAGLSVLVALGAAAAWWFIPPIFIKARALAFNIALGALAFNFVYSMGYQHGASTVKDEWERAERATADTGATIREDAEQAIPQEPDEPAEPAVEPAGPAGPPVAKPKRVRHKLDKYDRD